MRGSTNAQNVGRSTENLIFKDLNKDRTITPSADQWSNIIIADKNGLQLGQISQIMFPDGAMRTALGVFKTASTNAFLDLQIQADGTVYIILEKTVNGAYTSSIIHTL